MLAPDDNNGILTYLVALIILVMAAVGLSIFIDRRSKEGGARNDIRNEISTDAAEIKDLTNRVEVRGSELAENQKKADELAKQRAKATGAASRSETARADLTARRSLLQEEVANLEKSFTAYQDSYRRKTRFDAAGEKLGTLVTRDGRQFNEVSISRVTNAGLEIRHEHGMARLGPNDLDAKFQERFQWSAAERQQSLDVEQRNHENMPDLPEKEEPVKVVRHPVRPAPAPKPPTADQEQLRALQQDVSRWRVKVSRIRSDKSAADMNASYNSRSSVPGSLETWGAKASRLGRELSQAQAGLSAAKLRLADVAPNDANLREPVLAGDEQ